MRAITTRVLVIFAVTLPLIGCGESEPEPRHLTAAPEQRRDAPSPADTPPAPPPGETAAPTYAGVILSPPASWKAEAPASSMRVGQFRIENPGGEDATLAILHFGPAGAGSVDANLMRWTREVTDENGEPVVPEIGESEAGGLKITTFRSRGSYAASAPMGGGGEAQAGWMSLAAIIEGGPEGPLYLKATGPAELLEAQRDQFFAMLSRARPSTGAGPDSD